MHVPSYLLKNSFGIYHLRLAVPKKLRYLFGGREIKKSLLAGIYREALHTARRLAMFFLEIFEVFPLRTLNTMISGAIGTAKPGVVVGHLWSERLWNENSQDQPPTCKYCKDTNSNASHLLPGQSCYRSPKVFGRGA